MAVVIYGLLISVNCRTELAKTPASWDMLCLILAPKICGLMRYLNYLLCRKEHLSIDALVVLLLTGTSGKKSNFTPCPHNDSVVQRHRSASADAWCLMVPEPESKGY